MWLRYPDRYYIYKYAEVKAASVQLGASYTFKKGAYVDNIRNFLQFYDELNQLVKEDTELINLFQSQLTDRCYADQNLKTLTMDIGFYISRYYQINTSETDITGQTGAAYNPGFSVNDWKEMLEDHSIFTTSALEIVKRFKDYGGSASCTQLAVKYGESNNFYNTGSVALAKRICKAAGISPPVREDGSVEWWPVLYIGRKADKNEAGSFIWTLRGELSEALDQMNLTKISLYVESEDEEERGYWWLNANPKIWSFSNIAVNEVQSYTLYNENGNKRRVFQNFLDARAGDMVIGYESNPVKKVVAIGRISASQDGEKLYFEKI